MDALMILATATAIIIFIKTLPWRRQRRKYGNDLWVVTSYFNPAGYKSIRRNYKRFSQEMRSRGIKLLTVELSHTGAFVLSGNVVKVHSKDRMWQKERLLNIAISNLPRSCGYVAWIDADVTFLNERWMHDVIVGLQRHKVVQMFEQVMLLDPVGNFYKSAYGFVFSIINGFTEDPRGDRFIYQNGVNCKHTGFAWAARRTTLEAMGGLYDRHILGGGDYQMALAYFGMKEDHWYSRFTGAFHKDLMEWSEACYAIVHGDVGYIRGGILHHWHGHSDDRNYVARTETLNKHAYDPKTDVRVNEYGTLEWSSDKPKLHSEVKEYFRKRKDDSDHPVNPTRYEDKYPVIMSVPTEDAKLTACLRSMAHQDRKDFVIHILCDTWARHSHVKQLVRSIPWPMEIRFRVFSGTPELPRRLEAAYQIKRETSADKAIFISPNLVYHHRFVSRLIQDDQTHWHADKLLAVMLRDIGKKLIKHYKSVSKEERHYPY